MWARFIGIIGLLFTVGVPECVCDERENHNSIYVSSTTGNDGNKGMAPSEPLRTIKHALTKGNKVLLKAGDTFFLGNLDISGITLSRYGEGVNPIICGYKRIIEPRWKEVEKNTWKLNLAEDNFTGMILKGSSISNNICAFHDYGNDLIHGRKVWHKDEMNADWDFWQTETLKGAKPEEYDFVYLYLTTDPNKLPLEMSVYDSALRVENSIVDGVDFVGFGFGISAKSHTKIRNCRLDAIGGRIIPENNSYVCYGNGIEFYVSRTIDDCIVENCDVSRCYDCGVTIQGSNKLSARPRNIIIRNNRIHDCCQGWEDFLRNGDDVVYENCVFENNILWNNGNTTGFGYAPKRFKYCQVLGNNFDGNKGMIIRNNTFVGGNYYCSGAYHGEYKSNVWEGNTCVIKRGDFILSNYGGTRDVIRIPTERGEFRSLKAATDDAIRRYRTLTGDNTTEFVIKSEKRINRRVNRLKRKYLSE